MALAAAVDEKISVGADIDLLQMRIDQLVSEIDSTESLRTWEETQETWNNLKVADEAKDLREVYRLKQVLDLLFSRGATPHQKFAELIRVINQRAKLVQAEARIMADRRKAVSIESVLAFVRAMGLAVRECVRDLGDRQRLVDRMALLLKWDEPKEIQGEI
jgi:hypothetical protein